jgi:hypothetical protein
MGKGAMNTRAEFVTLLGREVCDCIEYRSKREWRYYFLDLKARLMLLYEQSRRRDEPYMMRVFYGQFISECQRKIKSLSYRLKQLERGEEQSGITEEEIRAAREHPIRNIVATKDKGRAICVNHRESRPSMDIRNNYAHCYACGWSGDVIDVYMKINGVSFPEAVRGLNEI